MKRQRQGVRSTRIREETEMNIPATPKAKDIYIKVHNATKRCTPTRREGSQQHKVKETSLLW